MFIFDAHLDMAWNATEFVRDLMLPVTKIREFEQHYDKIVPGPCTVSWSELQLGRVGLIVATLLPRHHRKDKPLTFPQSREACYAMSHGQLAYYRAMTARGVLREIADKAALDQHIAEWLVESRVESQESSARVDVGSASSGPPPSALSPQPPIGFILSMEGSTPILYPEQIEDWFRAGLRILGPAHYGPGPYCFGTGSVGGFNEDGKRMLREMARVGMLLDVTHLADQSFWDAMEIYHGPCLASHHNCRSLVPADRQLTDDQIKELIRRGSVIGAAFDNWMIRPGWTIGVSDPSTVQMAHIVDHIDHICQLAGNASHCGMGTDLDGGFGKEQSPSDLDTIADLGKMADILAKRGYSSDDVEKIMWRNFVEFFQRAWAK